MKRGSARELVCIYSNDNGVQILPLGGAGNNIFASFLYEKCLLSLVSYISNDFDSYLHVLLP